MRLSPRRLLNANRVAAFIRWRGDKVFLRSLYRAMREQHGMRPYAVDAAVDDLYHFGAAEMRIAGDDAVIILLHPDIGSALAARASLMSSATRPRGRRPFSERGRA